MAVRFAPIRSLQVALAVAIVGTEACRDPIVPEAPSASATRMVNQSRQGGDTLEAAVRDRFIVDIAADGSVRLGRPITLRATVQALVATRSVDVRIAVPELAMARGRLVPRPGSHASEVVPTFQQTRSLAAGQRLTSTTSIVIDAPGLYRAVATANASALEPMILDGKTLRDAARSELWILVDSSGGRILRRADETSVPAGWATLPGPRRVRQRDKLIAGITPQAISCDDPDPPPSCFGGGAGNYAVIAQWYNSDDGTYRPIRGAAYSASADGAPYGGNTDENGSLSVPCSLGPISITIDFRAPDKTQIERANQTIHAISYQTSRNPCGTTQTDVVTSFDFNAAKVYEVMRAAVDSSRSFFQFTRSSVTVNLIDGSPASEVSYYNGDQDKIWFKAGDIAGTRGVFTAGHEYGHALAQQSMSGARGGACPSTHYLDGYYNLQCALSEGFADYHAVASLGPSTGGYYWGIRGNTFYYGGDGSINEGAVAAFLFDLSARQGETDLISGVDYATHYRGRYVGEQMAGCRAIPWGGYATGIQHLVYCFEQQVDPWVVSNYFQTASPTSNGYSTPAAAPPSWDRSAIRRLWLNKLYGQ